MFVLRESDTHRSKDFKDFSKAIQLELETFYGIDQPFYKIERIPHHILMVYGMVLNQDIMRHIDEVREAEGIDGTTTPIQWHKAQKDLQMMETLREVAREDINTALDHIDNMDISQEEKDVITRALDNGEVPLDCIGASRRNPTAESGMKTGTIPANTKWKVVKDLKNAPTHEQGGVDLAIYDGKVTFAKGNARVEAKHGLRVCRK